MASFTVACIQLRSRRSIPQNVAEASELIRAAATAGATYIQTPEMTHLVQSNRAELMAEIRPESEDLGVEHFAALARELNIILHIGSLAILREDGKVANRAFLFGPDGARLARYDKIHMFDVDLDNGESWRESNTYTPGSASPVVETPFARIGLAICYDVRFPEIFRRQALAGADILTSPACFTRQTGMAHWQTLMRARAIENGAFMISAAQGGKHEDGRHTYGHSIVVDPWGIVLAEADHEDPGFITAEINLESIDQARRKIPVLTHAREFATQSL